MTVSADAIQLKDFHLFVLGSFHTTLEKLRTHPWRSIVDLRKVLTNCTHPPPTAASKHIFFRGFHGGGVIDCPLPHAPGARMTLPEQTPSNYRCGDKPTSRRPQGDPKAPQKSKMHGARARTLPSDGNCNKRTRKRYVRKE